MTVYVLLGIDKGIYDYLGVFATEAGAVAYFNERNRTLSDYYATYEVVKQQVQV